MLARVRDTTWRVPKIARFHCTCLVTLQTGTFPLQQYSPLFFRVAVHGANGIGFNFDNG